MERNPEVIQNYAQAYLHTAKNEGTELSDVRGESLAFRDLILSRPRFKTFLDVPNISEETKKEMIEKALRDNVSGLMYRFILLLLKRNRIDHLTDVLKRIAELANVAMGITPGRVITAITLSDDEQQNLQQRLEAFCDKKFDLEYRVDPRIIGGVRFVYEDQLLDTTIQTGLHELRRRLWETRLAKPQTN